MSSNFHLYGQAWTPPAVGGGGGGLDYDFSDWASGAISASRNMTIRSGVAVLDGGVLISTGTYASAGTLTFTATFDGGGFQHVGFATDLSGGPWAIISSMDGSGGASPGIWGRASVAGAGSSTNTLLVGASYGVSYNFKIEWASAANAKFYVNNVLKATIAVATGGPLSVMASDFARDGSILTLSAIAVDGTSIIL